MNSFCGLLFEGAPVMASATRNVHRDRGTILDFDGSFNDTSAFQTVRNGETKPCPIRACFDKTGSKHKRSTVGKRFNKGRR